MIIRCVTITLPITLPLQPHQVEQSLAAALTAEWGSHELVRWAITRIKRDPDPATRHATLEAVLTLP